MLQAPCYPSPLVYGQSHYKKFWLRQTETEDETAVAPQHVANCSQKFSTLSSSFSAMAGAPSQTQNQAGSSKAGTPAPSANASLAACAKSYNDPRALALALEPSRSTNKVVSEYDLNQYEDSSEPGAVDCTLSLGTVKRERAEAAVPTGVSRSGSPAFGEVAHPYYNPQAAWGAGCPSEPQILFNNRNFPSDCTRDLYPQTTVPARQSRLASGSQNHLYAGSVGSTIEGTKISGFPRPKKSPLFVGVEKGGAAVLTAENCAQDSYRNLAPSAIGFCRTTSWIPSLASPEAGTLEANKYCEAPSAFNTGAIASPISGQSVNGEDGRFPQRSTLLDLGGNGATSSKNTPRMCAHCSTTKTPLWRNGPDGPKSLCNACGIRHKKLGKKNPSNGSSSEPGSSLPASPQSVKFSPSKALKRKKNAQPMLGISKQSWAPEEGARRNIQVEPSAQPWKRNRSSATRLELTESMRVDTTTTETSGSEADENETGGSSGNSCLTWQHQLLNNVITEVPSSSSVFPVVDPSERSVDDFMKTSDAAPTTSESQQKRDSSRAPVVNAEDTGSINAEEAAMCLMKMSSGFGSHGFAPRLM
ncbi:protein MpGATA4 [Marchantia polymorpha subsp. ruderalis]|uniref:GATA-type domain-containing protein n=2 Tax=Marchantia polymorpha TaxID=3197 RepID=A0A176WLY0_MARPO|nr:hypothetical protein AXG93_1593s1190 [Marchantia polymorpha subsp. ruderalis]PTQ35058.1 hypothetical protein MARPO_0074s0047 [Marchantia polymorpha]BBN16107.1 hypothetical protein Mp_7g03490 [Marchantia polymorpha subsp. ruderalis]|eukprot:PTQ35058.1 hypothetical protein MARPO_0074s0047 [Marchantia polymorpha]